jgi:hypothetical protein
MPSDDSTAEKSTHLFEHSIAIRRSSCRALSFLDSIHAAIETTENFVDGPEAAGPYHLDDVKVGQEART